MSDAVSSGKLFARIAQTMGKVRSLPKEGYNKQNGYHYVTSDTALDAIGKAMAECGVIVIPSMTAYETVTENKMTRCKAEFLMHVCGTDGDVFTSQWTAEGIDYGNPDKALTKAITYATKTFLLKLFVVGAGGDDPDGESAPTDSNAASQTTQKQPQRQQKATPTNGTHRTPADVQELAGSVGATVTEVDDPETALGNARKKFHAEVVGTFSANDADDARHWLIEAYTTKTTPDNVRKSTNDLNIDELSALTEALRKHRKTYRDRWIAEKTHPIPATDKQLVTA